MAIRERKLRNKRRAPSQRKAMRIVFITFLMAIAFVSNVVAQHSLEVAIKNIKSSEGTVKVAIFTNEKDFLKNAYQTKSVKAATGSVAVSFDNLPEGPYALSIFHDENDNGKLDTNFMGIPKEGFAFGNNAMGTFGPPSFAKSKIELTAPASQEISLRFM